MKQLWIISKPGSPTAITESWKAAKYWHSQGCTITPFSVKEPNVGHLSEIGESYTTHARHALWIAAQTAKITVALVIHAIFPDVLVTYASDKLASIQRYRDARKK